MLSRCRVPSLDTEELNEPEEFVPWFAAVFADVGNLQPSQNYSITLEEALLGTCGAYLNFCFTLIFTNF